MKFPYFGRRVAVAALWILSSPMTDAAKADSTQPLVAQGFSMTMNGLFYNPSSAGSALGRLKLIQSMADLSHVGTEDLAILTFVPDVSLPVARAWFFSFSFKEFQALKTQPSGPWAQIEDMAKEPRIADMLKSTRHIGVFIEKEMVVVGELTPDEVTSLSQPVDPLKVISQFGLPPTMASMGIREVSTEICNSDYLELQSLEVFTGPGEYASEPYVHEVRMKFPLGISELQIAKGTHLMIKNSDFEYVGHPFMHHGPWDLSFSLIPTQATQMGFSDFSIYQWNSWDIYRKADGASFRWPPEGAPHERCSREIHYRDAKSQVRANLLDRAFGS